MIHRFRCPAAWEEVPSEVRAEECPAEVPEALTGAGLELAGLSPDGRLVEIVELRDHPWFVGVQFHPELKSRPNRAHPLFREFIAAAGRQAKSKQAI